MKASALQHSRRAGNGGNVIKNIFLFVRFLISILKCKCPLLRTISKLIPNSTRRISATVQLGCIAKTILIIPAGARRRDSDMSQKQLSESTASLFLMLNMFIYTQSTYRVERAVQEQHGGSGRFSNQNTIRRLLHRSSPMARKSKNKGPTQQNCRKNTVLMWRCGGWNKPNRGHLSARPTSKHPFQTGFRLNVENAALHNTLNVVVYRL